MTIKAMIMAIIYTIIVLVSSFFMTAFSWGEKLNIFQKGIIFLLTSPLKIEQSLWYIPLNGFFWGGIILLLKHCISLLKSKVS